jgi:hypothetical protein
VLFICRFLDNKEDIAKLRKSFAGLWSLDNEEIVKSAIEKPDLFVLKPQREGGGMFSYHLELPFGHIFEDPDTFLQGTTYMVTICKTHL